MNDTTLSAAERIGTFAAAVRAELADLPEEEIDDLIGGLIGDLTDQAQDADGDIDLDDPVAYAQELRDAAGLPVRSADLEPQISLAERASAWGTRTLTGIRATAFGAWLIDLLVSLRPVWWVLRGVGMYGVGCVLLALLPGGEPTFAPHNLFRMLLLIGLILVSVQWGRGRWKPMAWVRVLATILSILALIMLPVLAGAVGNHFVVYDDYQSDSESYIPNGLLLDGVQIGNLFVYDTAGNPIDGVQIFTNKGTPVNLYGADSSAMSSGSAGAGDMTVPLRDLQGRPIWNVYPLDLVPMDAADPSDPAVVRPANPPLRLAPDLEELTRSDSETTPDPAPSASPEPLETPAP